MRQHVYPRCYCFRGCPISHQSKTIAAIGKFCRAIEIDPNDVTVTANLGMNFAGRSKTDKADGGFAFSSNLPPQPYFTLAAFAL